MHAYTEYFGESREDEAIARLCAVVSYDEGESWGERVLLLEKAPEEQNIMSPSLFRLKNGEMGMVYLRKMMRSDGTITCMPVFRSSADEGKNWSDWVQDGEIAGTVGQSKKITAVQIKLEDAKPLENKGKMYRN